MLTAKPPYWPTPNLPMARRKYRRVGRQTDQKTTPKVDQITDLLDDPHSLQQSPPPIYFSHEPNRGLLGITIYVDVTPYSNRI